jgi:hypothetical protein
VSEWLCERAMLFHLVPFGTMLACKPAAGAGAGYKNGTPFTEQYAGRGTEPETTAYGTFDGMPECARAASSEQVVYRCTDNQQSTKPVSTRGYGGS